VGAFAVAIAVAAPSTYPLAGVGLGPFWQGFELDFALRGPDRWLNVEVDGDHHVDDRGQQIREDVVRDRILRSVGWDVLRVKAWRCWSDLTAVVEDVKAALGPDGDPAASYGPPGGEGEPT